MYTTDIKRKEQTHQVKQKLSADLRLQLERELYKQSFFDFFKAAVYVLKPVEWSINWHHQFLCDLLQKDAERIVRNERREHHIIINCPPSVTKSTIVSVIYNAWLWTINPHACLIQLSHSEDLSIEFSTKCQDLITSKWYQELFPHIRIRQDSTAKSNFKLEGYSGQRISLSLLAGLTGHHGSQVIIDDYADAKSVSPLKLESAQKIYTEVVQTRLESPTVGSIILIGQRISDQDLYAHLLSKNQDDRYKHICLPMELSDDVKPIELRDKYTNGVLWHDRFPVESFAGLTDSPQVWATQFMQSPRVSTGNIIRDEWFDKVDSCPATDYHLFIDSAYTNKKTGDPSALMVAGVHENTIYIKHSGQYWLEFPELIRKIKELAEQYHIKKIYIEPKASGLSIAQQLRKETMLNVVELPAPKESKTARLHSITAKLESKRVKLLKEGWNENFLYEVTTFPNAKHDDQLDNLTAIVQTLLNGSGKIYWYM